MLTSSVHSQYLQPDYLQPLPTTLDAKNSPLALLAQTCSSIGKDTTPSKSIIPPLDKKDREGNSSSSSSGRKSESPKHHRSSPDGRRSQPRDGGSRDGDKRESTSDSDSKHHRPTPKDIPALVPIRAGSKSPHDRSELSSKSPSSSSAANNKESTPVRCSSSHSISASASTSAATQSSSNSRISLSCGNMLLEVNHNDSYSTGLPKSHHQMPIGHPSIPPTYKHDPLSLSSMSPYGAYPGCSSLSLLGHPGAMAGLDPASASSLYSASLAQHGALAGLSHKSSLSPYVGYARIKTTSGATTLVPFCRDPYCTNCQITLQNAQLGGSAGCGAGCTQCSHDKCVGIPTSLGSTSLGSHVMSHTPGLASLAGVASAASSLPLPSSLYSHAFGVMPGHHGLPYVCNWVQGSEHCGKRFTTSEELLQHLRTHTTAGEGMSSLAASGLSPYSSLGLAGCSSFHSTPGSVSPNSLRQMYPRSVSPASLLAASRFHPYKSPLAGLSSPVSAGLPGSVPQPLGLGSYYSPYALYAQRLGAAAVAP